MCFFIFFHQQPLCSFLTCCSYFLHPSWMSSTTVLMLFPSCSGMGFQSTGIHYYQSDIPLSGVFLNDGKQLLQKSGTVCWLLAVWDLPLRFHDDSTPYSEFLRLWFCPYPLLKLHALIHRELTDRVVDKAESLSKL